MSPKMQIRLCWSLTRLCIYSHKTIHVIVFCIVHRSIHEGGGITSQATLRPLLKQVVENIFDSAKPELVDIEYKSTGFRDLLKSGFGQVSSGYCDESSDVRRLHSTLWCSVLLGVLFNQTPGKKKIRNFNSRESLLLLNSNICCLPPGCS